MKTTPENIRWPDRWFLLFGYHPAVPEVDAIEAWLTEHFPRGWEPDELHDALEDYAETERKAGNTRPKTPTCPKIKSIIVRLRYERRIQRDGGASRKIKYQDPETKRIQTRTVAWARDALTYETDPDERFEIICGIIEEKETEGIQEELFSYAQSLPGGIRRFNPEEHAAEQAAREPDSQPVFEPDPPVVDSEPFL